MRSTFTQVTSRTGVVWRFHPLHQLFLNIEKEKNWVLLDVFFKVHGTYRRAKFALVTKLYLDMPQTPRKALVDRF